MTTPTPAPRTADEPLGVLTASAAPDGDRRDVRFERRYPTSPADLWSALTEPDRLARWLGVLTGDLRVGGRYHLQLGDAPEEHAVGEVRACQAPTRLVVGWTYPGEDRSEVEAQITAVRTPAGPEASTLVLVHRLLQADQAVGYGAGWHAYLDVLADALAGRPAGTDDVPTWDERFEVLLDPYRTAAAGA